MGTAVVRRCNGTESFLSGGIPNLELDCLSVQLDRSNFEIYTDRGNVGFGVSVIRESKKQTRFTNTGVSNKEQLEQIIAVIAIIYEDKTRKKRLDDNTLNASQFRLTGKEKKEEPRLQDVLHSRNDLLYKKEIHSLDLLTAKTYHHGMDERH